MHISDHICKYGSSMHILLPTLIIYLILSLPKAMQLKYQHKLIVAECFSFVCFWQLSYHLYIKLIVVDVCGSSQIQSSIALAYIRNANKIYTCITLMICTHWYIAYCIYLVKVVHVLNTLCILNSCPEIIKQLLIWCYNCISLLLYR